MRKEASHSQDWEGAKEDLTGGKHSVAAKKSWPMSKLKRQTLGEQTSFSDRQDRCSSANPCASFLFCGFGDRDEDNRHDEGYTHVYIRLMMT